jgi:membrane protease YdiL (CAAX protease family)
VAAALTYCIFLGMLWWARFKCGVRLINDDGFALGVGALLVLHIAGILLFAVVPISTGASLASVHPRVPGALSFAVTLLFLATTMILSLRLSKKKLEEVKKITAVKIPSRTILASYFVLRIIFIGAYEFWFRGYLLFICEVEYGISLAIAINILLYAVLHIVNGWKETIACIPFGLILCAISLWTGSAWPAIIIHLSLTIPFEASFVVKMKDLKRMAYENAVQRVGVQEGL